MTTADATMTTQRRPRLRAFASRLGSIDRWAEFACYLAAALIVTWPLASHLTTALPLGTERISTVPLFNVWTIWWNSMSATRGFEGYWDAPIFAPNRDAFSYSETQLSTLIVAPFVWFCSTPILAYNVYLLVNLAANGWAAARLLGGITGHRSIGIAGGLMVEMLPLIHWQLGVLQLVPLWGILWTIHALHAFGRVPSYGRGLNLAAAFIVTHLLCHHYSLFLSVLLIPSGIWLLGGRLLERKTWLALLPAVCLVGAILGPMIYQHHTVMRAHDWRRPRELVDSLSAEFADYATSPWPQYISTLRFSDRRRMSDWKLGFGSLTGLLAIVGLFYGVFVPRMRRWTGFCLTLAVLSVLLSLGPKLRWNGLCPYEWLAAYFPGFAQLRNVFRFAIPAQLAIVFLAVNGLLAMRSIPFVRIWRHLQNRFRGRASDRWNGSVGNAPANPDTPLPQRVNRWAAVAVLLLGLAAAWEVRPEPQRLYHVPPFETQRAWIDWVRQETPPDAVLACLPFPTHLNVWHQQPTAEAMYWSTFHRRRLVNGYSGFYPAAYYELNSAMQSFPHAVALDELERHNVRYCVVRVDADSAERMPPNPFPADRLQLRFRDQRAHIEIYELRRTPSSAGER